MTARILITDDGSQGVRDIEATLNTAYYEVSLAQDGFEAVRRARAWQPDLIFLLTRLAEVDGVEVCRRLKADRQTMHIPVVMLSADGAASEGAASDVASSDVLRGLEAGADDGLVLPADDAILLARVRSLSRVRRVLDELRARGETARALGVSTLESAPHSVSGARALVVGDVDLSAQAMQDDLSREGILPGRASSEAEVMALTGAIPFDLIVLSLSLAHCDPLRLVSRLRASDITHEIPVLLVAGPDQRADMLRGFELGANDSLASPPAEQALRSPVAQPHPSQVLSGPAARGYGQCAGAGADRPADRVLQSALPDAASARADGQRAPGRAFGDDG